MKTKVNTKTPVGRLNYSGSLTPVIGRLYTAYNVGEPTDFSVIESGYEDCNVIIQTSRDKYVAKIFAKERSREDIVRYATIMEKAVKAGVHHPPLIQTDDGNVVYVDRQANGISLVLMKFIEGKTFIELGRVPDADERRMVIEQAATINTINYHPPYLFDSWAIPNIHIMFEKVKGFIRPEDFRLVELAIARYADIPVDGLPHCFVHGDFTKTNVLKGNDGKVYILDFSVANWYPRIQELAVIVANLLYDRNSSASLHEIIALAVNEYTKLQPLTAKERNCMYPYTLAGIAMEFLGAHQEKYIHGNDTVETDFWMKLGRDGLKRELEDFTSKDV